MTTNESQDESSTTTAEPDWQERFHARSVSVLAIPWMTHDRAIVGFSAGGEAQLHIWAEDEAGLLPLTSRPGGFPLGTPIAISPHGDWAAYFDDEGGSEVGHWISISTADGSSMVIAPELGPIASSSLAVNASGDRAAFDRHADGVTTIEVLRFDAERNQVRLRSIPAAGLVVPACFLPSGALALVEYSDDGTTAVVVVDGETGQEIGRLSEPGIRYVAWKAAPTSPDQLLASTDVSGFRRPFIWAPDTGERRPLDLGDLDDMEADIRGVDWSPGGRYLLLWQAWRAVGDLYVFDLSDGSTRRLDVPPGTLGGLPFDFGMGFISDDAVLARWEDADHAPTLLRIPLDGSPASPVLPREPLPPGHPWQSVTFPSMDGTPIQGWLAVPDGVGPHPAVIDAHGGPTYVQGSAFSPLLQAFVDRGYAVLSVNYRGSTTFGSDYQNAINGQAGRLEVEDLVAGRDWLVHERIARSDAILIEGLSYGGYLALLAVGSYPDRWAGAIAFVAVGDSVAGFEDSSEGVRSLDLMTFGGRPEDAPEMWRRGSPITYAEQVIAPIIVFNGRNDSRCPARQMEQYETRLAELGKQIEVVWFDAGHLASGERLLIEQAERSLAFADQLTARLRDAN